jgi:hypothetical protein
MHLCSDNIMIGVLDILVFVLLALLIVKLVLLLAIVRPSLQHVSS